MSEDERTGTRPGGFSKYLRSLYASGPLRDATRHVDIDNLGAWDWYCAGCGLPFALIEDKYRSSSPPWPVQEREWKATRTLAHEAGVLAFGIAWTNACQCGECVPTQMDIQVFANGEISKTTASLEALLIRAHERHLSTCRRAAA